MSAAESIAKMPQRIRPDVALLIEKVLERLSVESRWIKGCYAKTADGKPTQSRNIEAVCWSLVGAFNSFSNMEISNMEISAWASCLVERQAATIRRFHGGLSGFNDNAATTHADVMKVLRDTLAVVGAA